MLEDNQGKQITYGGYTYSLENGGLVIKDNNDTVVGTLVYDNYDTNFIDDDGNEIFLSSSDDTALYINPSSPNSLYTLSSNAIKLIDISDKMNPALITSTVLVYLYDDPYVRLSSYRFFNNQVVVTRIQDNSSSSGIDSIYFNLPGKNDAWSKINVRNQQSYIIDNTGGQISRFDFIDTNNSVAGIVYDAGSGNEKSKVCLVANKQVTSTCINHDDRLKSLRANGSYIFAAYDKEIDVYDFNLTFLYSIDKRATGVRWKHNYYDLVFDGYILKAKSRYCDYSDSCVEDNASYFQIKPNGYDMLIPTDNSKAIVVNTKELLISQGPVQGIKKINNSLVIIGTELKDYTYTNEGGKKVTEKTLQGPIVEKYNLDKNLSSIILSLDNRAGGFKRLSLIDVNESDIYLIDEGYSYPKLKRIALDTNSTEILLEDIGFRDLYDGFTYNSFNAISYDNDSFIYIPQDYYHDGMMQYDIKTNLIKHSKRGDNDPLVIAYDTNLPYFYNQYALVLDDSFIYIYSKSEYSKLKRTINELKKLNNISGHIIKFANDNFIITDEGVGFVKSFDNAKDGESIDFISFNDDFKDIKVISNYIFGLTDNKFIIYKLDTSNKTIARVYQMTIPNYVGGKVFEIDKVSKQIYIGGNGYLIKLSYSF